MGFKGHNLNLKVQPDGRVVGSCSCGKWKGLGKDAKYVTEQWNKKHINPMDDWK